MPTLVPRTTLSATVAPGAVTMMAASVSPIEAVPPSVTPTLLLSTVVPDPERSPMPMSAVPITLSSIRAPSPPWTKIPCEEAASPAVPAAFGPIRLPRMT